jgi:hypothetical protein
MYFHFHNKFHIPIFNTSLVTIIKLKITYWFHMTIILYKKSPYKSFNHYHTTFLNPTLQGARITPSQKIIMTAVLVTNSTN